jgi:bifunctional DNase/RNase
MIEMKVAGIALDAISRSPIVLLKDASERRALPIFIGQDQARAIIGALERQQPPRPLTHDLMVNIFNVWNLKLERIIINSLQDNTFYGVLCMKLGKKEKQIDCRPSDAIAIALRTGCPIWVMEEVVVDASIPVNQEADEEERKAFKDFVSNLSPEELIRRAKANNSENS